MNIVTLIGRLTRDPELRFTPGTGTGVTTVTLAVDNYNSKIGEKTADFIPVVIYGTKAENVAQYLLKGSQIAVSGRIATRNYDAKDGTKRYVTEVVCNNVELLERLVSKKENTTEQSSDPYATFGEKIETEQEISLDDIDLPFE